MPDNAGSIALLRAVLRDNCPSDEAARRHLSEALLSGLDPLDYCAHRFGLGHAVVWQRAAQWAGFTFAAQTPTRVPLPRIDRIAHLGQVRTLRQPVLGRDMQFLAPRFAQVLNLSGADETLRTHVRFVPPPAIESGIAAAASAQLIAGAQQNVTRLWPRASAAQDLPLHVRIGFALLLVAIVVAVVAAGLTLRPVLVPFAAVLLLVPGLMRFAAALPARSKAAPRLLPDAELPVYSVLVPLRDEAGMVPMLARALAAIDYPSEKLDIKFVVESRSDKTVAAVRRVLGDPRFRMVVVPDCLPHTKPKAIDYALPLARGRYLVVFDAEDVPDPGQLREAASRFAADPTLACLQAELVPENAGENALTGLFAGEYAGLFGRLLPALARWGLPVPLGGTSNHFRIEYLRALGGWDAFNVTEDADLGVRLARCGLRAEAFASRTLEEAPVTLKAWMAQRTRWTKGWMQTFIVHNRAAHLFLKDLGWRAFLGFEVLIGGMIVTSLLHTALLVTLAVRLVLEGSEGVLPHDVWDWISLAILVSGYAGAFVIQVSGLIRQRAYRLLPLQLLLPFYWCLHSCASLWAAGELVFRPIYWAKTTHGVTRVERAGAAPAGEARLRPRIG